MAQELIDFTAPDADTLPAGALKINNNFTELYSVKLDASGYTAADVVAKLLTVDGAGSGLDADLLDGISSAGFFQTANALVAVNGTVAAPTYGFADAGLGIYRSASNVLSFAVSGVKVASFQTGPIFLLGDGTSSTQFRFNGVAGTTRDILVQSAGVTRWVWRVNATAEAGSNTGSDFELQRRDDAGATLGTVRIPRATGQWLLEDGTVAAPELSFATDPDCGLYRVSANVLGFAAGGVDVMRVVTTGIDMAVSDAQMKKTADTGRWILCGGSANNLANGATIRVEGIDYLGAGLGGAIELGTSANRPVSLTGTGAQLRGQNGTVALPALSFINDTDCGLYRIGTNNIGLAVNAAKVLDVATTGLTVTGNVTLGALGNGLAIKEGTNAAMGVATLVAGTVTVANTRVTAVSRIQLTGQTLGTVAVPSAMTISARTVGTSFTILASALTDTSVVAWEIVEPAP